MPDIKNSLWYKRQKEKQSIKTTKNGHQFILHPIISIANKNSDPNINRAKLNNSIINTPKGEELNEMQLNCIYLNKTKLQSLNNQSAQSVREKVFPNSKCTRRASTYKGLLLTPTKLSRVVVPVTPCPITPYYNTQKTNQIKKSNSNSKLAKIIVK